MNINELLLFYRKIIKMKFSIISGSVRTNRQSHQVSQYLESLLKDRQDHEVELLDLIDYQFPIMEERLRMTDDPDPLWVQFSKTVNESDGIVIVSPEYNGSYPGVLKNVLDYLKDEYFKKTFGIVTVSSGHMGGINASHHLESWVLHVKGYPSPFKLMVPNIDDLFNERGEPREATFVKQAGKFLDEFLWLTQAISQQKRVFSSQ